MVKLDLPFRLYKLKIGNLATVNYKYLYAIYALCSRVPRLCGEVIQTIITTNMKTDIINWRNRNELFRNIPGGSSTKNLSHWIQILQTQKLMQFDYRDEQLNIKHYGQKSPPLYDISQFKNYSVESFVTNGKYDPFGSGKDFDFMMQQMGDLSRITVKNLDFNHLDYIWSDEACKSLYPEVLKFLSR